MKDILILEKPTPGQTKLILSSISSLYHDPEAIIFEYIQNSIDSAVEYQKKFPGCSPRQIFVHIDEKNKKFIIQDNCVGMSSTKISELPTKIFDSEKKQYPWIVGQFGYGIQSFRSWFKKVTLLSKIAGEKFSNSISFQEEDVVGKVDKLSLLPFSAIYSGASNVKVMVRDSGTDVVIEDIVRKDKRNSSFDYIASNIVKKIPVHFEDFIANKTVEITVLNWTGSRGKGSNYKCRTLQLATIDYSEVKGEPFAGQVEYKGRKIADYSFKVIDSGYINENKELADYKPKISRLGTRINSIADMSSFKKYCEDDLNHLVIWSRPEIIGKMNIVEKIDIDIDRSDISPSEIRDSIYQKLVEVSDQMEAFIEQNEKEKMESHAEQLSEIISDAFTDISKGLDRFFMRKKNVFGGKEPATSETGGIGLENSLNAEVIKNGVGKGNPSNLAPNNNTEEKMDSKISDNDDSPKSDPLGEKKTEKIKQRGIDIQIKPLGEQMEPSQMWGESLIVINSQHPYYHERSETSKKRMITKRLISYIAFVATPWYLDLYYKAKGMDPDSKEKNLLIIDTIAKFESMLWCRRDLMQKYVTEVEGSE